MFETFDRLVFYLFIIIVEMWGGGLKYIFVICFSSQYFFLN